MDNPITGIWEMFSNWTIGGVSVIVWIIGFLLISIVAIFVKGNK